VWKRRGHMSGVCAALGLRGPSTVRLRRVGCHERRHVLCRRMACCGCPRVVCLRRRQASLTPFRPALQYKLQLACPRCWCGGCRIFALRTGLGCAAKMRSIASRSLLALPTCASGAGCSPTQACLSVCPFKRASSRPLLLGDGRAQVAAMRGELASLNARLTARDEQLLKHVRVSGRAEPQGGALQRARARLVPAAPGSAL